MAAQSPSLHAAPAVPADAGWRRRALRRSRRAHGARRLYHARSQAGSAGEGFPNGAGPAPPPRRKERKGKERKGARGRRPSAIGRERRLASPCGARLAPQRCTGERALWKGRGAGASRPVPKPKPFRWRTTAGRSTVSNRSAPKPRSSTSFFSRGRSTVSNRPAPKRQRRKAAAIRRFNRNLRRKSAASSFVDPRQTAFPRISGGVNSAAGPRTCGTLYHARSQLGSAIGMTIAPSAWARRAAFPGAPKPLW